MKEYTVLPDDKNVLNRLKVEWQQFMLSAIEQSFDGIAVADLDYKLTYVNPAWAMMHDYDSSEELIGKSIKIFHSHEQMEKEVKPFIQVVKEKGVNKGEMGHIRKDGTPFCTLMTTTLLKNAQKMPVAILGIMKDITERKKIEEVSKQGSKLIKKQLTELENLYKSAPLGMCFVDKELRYLRINQSMADINGKSITEHIGRLVEEVIPKIAADIIPIYQKVIESGEPAINLEIQGLTAANPVNPHDWIVSYYPVKADDGSILGVHTIVSDITERKKADEALLKAKNELEFQVEKRTTELARKNIALKEILDQIELEKRQVTDRVTANVDKLLLPVIKKLKGKSSSLDNRYLEILEQNLKELTSSFGISVANINLNFTSKEIEICNLIKEGFTGKEIAAMQNLSYKTIDSHRCNIRKKLGITLKKVNLSSYLKSLHR